MISFKTGSKPELSQEEYNAAAESSKGGKFLNTPGTFDLAIVGATFKETPSEKDDAWYSLTVELQDSEGRGMKHFVLVPTECRNSFLFGKEKSAFAYENLASFVRGLGIALDYDNAMSQIAQIFGAPEKLVGKVIKARIGYKQPYIKYLGKEGDDKQYQIVDKDGKPKTEDIFADAKAAQKFATDNKIKLGFCNVLEIYGSKEPQLLLTGAGASAPADDLPF